MSGLFPLLSKVETVIQLIKHGRDVQEGKNRGEASEWLVI